MSSTRGAGGMHAADEEPPAYGIRINGPGGHHPDHQTSGSRGPMAGADNGSATPHPIRPRASAYRRMVGGLSFASCMLGILVVFGLAAAAHPRWAILGALPLVVGAAGLISVRWRLVPVFRDHEGRRQSRRGTRWFWLPAGMVALSIVFFVIGYMVPHWMHGSNDVLVRNHVVMWTELGFLFLLMASLAAGLVALGLWSTPDDDDAILRRTDYAERDRKKRGGSTGDLYDSDWIQGHG